MGLVAGAVGGFATLEISPWAAAPAALLWLLAIMPSRRLAALAGAVVGHGVAWCLLIGTSFMSCSSSCHYSLAYGPAHLEDGNAWVAETRLWLVASAGILLVGLVLTAWSAIRSRRGRAR